MRRTFYKMDGSVGDAEAADVVRDRHHRHVYVVGYRYDLSGRLVALVSCPACASGRLPTRASEYDATTGLLSAVVDPLAIDFEFTYNVRNEPSPRASWGNRRYDDLRCDGGCSWKRS